MSNLFWQQEVDDRILVGLTAEALETFGQLWAIIPSSDRKRNFKEGDQIVAIEGSDGMGCLNIEFPVNKISFNGDAIERPDEMTTSTPLFYAEAA